jgi:hypothetical protein
MMGEKPLLGLLRRSLRRLPRIVRFTAPVPAGAFHPLVERVRPWAGLPPGELLERLHADLLDHSDGRLEDDLAALAAYRPPGETRP